jgi:hypothetical protein
LLGIRAYDDCKTFGALPYAGGLWDQPAELVDEMRAVANAVKEREAAEIKKAERERKRGN